MFDILNFGASDFILRRFVLKNNIWHIDIA